MGSLRAVSPAYPGRLDLVCRPRLQRAGVSAALLMTFLFFAAHARAWPFKKELHNKVKSIGELVIFVVLIVVLLAKPKLNSELQRFDQQRA